MSAAGFSSIPQLYFLYVERSAETEVSVSLQHHQIVKNVAQEVERDFFQNGISITRAALPTKSYVGLLTLNCTVTYSAKPACVKIIFSTDNAAALNCLAYSSINTHIVA